MQKLFNYAQALSKALVSAKPEDFNPSFSLDLDCDTLPCHGEEGKCDENEITGEFFQRLKQVEGPALYWFEIISANTAESIYTKGKMLGHEIGRATPATKKYLHHPHSKVLYVGKVKKDLWGRMVVHLGYLKNPHTQGLQLCFWTKDMGLHLRLHVIQLPEDMREMAGLFERELAEQLKPILGKHR